VLVVLLTATSARADSTQLGVFFGPRLFSDDSLLGYIDDAPAHPTLASSVELGFRAGRPFLPWLVPEVELAIAPTHTNPTVPMSVQASVFWMEPRVHLRFELLPGKRVMPFILAGGGSAIALSSAQKTYSSDLLGDGYVGGGVRIDTFKGFSFRADARVSIVPGVDHAITPELDISVGIVFHVGEKRRGASEASGPIADKDGDGIPDDKDQCPDRAEDKDGFQDQDGCPDIDNDNDRVLDIADKCPVVPETYNGFQDEDGCPDTVPAEVDALKGTLEGLIYAEGETQVRESAQPTMKKIADALAKQPSVKIVLVGHTDNHEAKQFATPDQQDLSALSADLSRARAESVRIELVKLGVNSGRITVEGHGADEPVSDNDTPRGRLANRRVELKLFVPQAR
jgi:outer membrane protein OmpA-like peptidoglycan-associated protein